MINDELVDDQSQARRVEARRIMDGERRRQRCKHCRERIPQTRARQALTCSPFCSRNAGPARREELLAEIRAVLRAAAYPKQCPDCDEPMPPLPQYGRIPKRCKRCRKNRNGLKYYHQRQEARR